MSETMTVTKIENVTVPEAHRLIEGRDDLGRKASWDVPAATFQRFAQAGGQVGSVVTIYDDGGFLIVANPETQPEPQLEPQVSQQDNTPPAPPASQPQADVVPDTEGQATARQESTPAPTAPTSRAVTKPKKTNSATTTKARAAAPKAKPKPKPKAQSDVRHLCP